MIAVGHNPKSKAGPEFMKLKCALATVGGLANLTAHFCASSGPVTRAPIPIVLNLKF